MKALNALVAALSISCLQEQPQRPIHIYGTVLKESGSIVDRVNFVQNSKKGLFIEPTYALQIRADNETIYTFSVEDARGKLEALNLAIEEGTRIQIYTPRFYDNLSGTVSKIYDEDIAVLEK